MLSNETLTALKAGFVPADAIPGVLLGWTGPIEWCAVAPTWRPGVWGPIGASSGRPVWGIVTSTDGHDRSYRIRLPLSRPEVRHRIAVVMAAGERCLDAPIKGRSRCDRCGNTGYLRPPAPCWHLLPREESATGHALGAEVAAGLPACHVARVLAGLGGVLEALGPWKPHKSGISERSGGRVAAWNAPGSSAYGWRYWPRRESGPTAYGPETGSEGQQAADRAALAASYALQNADGLVLPWPEVSP